MLTSWSTAVDAFEDFLDLLFQRQCRERLDHVTVDPGLGGFDDLFTLGFGGHHQHRQAAQFFIGAHVTQQVDTGHARHVPVGYQKVDAPAVEDRNRRNAVIRLDRVGEPKVTQQLQSICALPVGAPAPAAIAASAAAESTTTEQRHQKGVECPVLFSSVGLKTELTSLGRYAVAMQPNREGQES